MSPDQDWIRCSASELTPLLDTVRCGAVELLRPEPDLTLIAEARLALGTMQGRATGIAFPLSEVIELVIFAFNAACAPGVTQSDGLGYSVTAAVADLARVIHAILQGENPEPFVDHARAMIDAMPHNPSGRSPIPDASQNLVEVDLNDREGLSRLLATVTGTPPTPEHAASVVNETSSLGSPPSKNPYQLTSAGMTLYGEIEACLDVYARRAHALLDDSGSSGAIDSILRATSDLQLAARRSDLEPIEWVATSVIELIEAHRLQAMPLSPDAREFVLAGRLIIPLILASTSRPLTVAPVVERLVAQSSDLLKQLHSSTQEPEDYWPEQAGSADPAAARHGLDAQGDGTSRTPVPAEAADVPGESPATLRDALRMLDTGNLAPSPPSEASTADPRSLSPDGAVQVVQDVSKLLPVLDEFVPELERRSATDRFASQMLGALRALRGALPDLPSAHQRRASHPDIVRDSLHDNVNIP